MKTIDSRSFGNVARGGGGVGIWQTELRGSSLTCIRRRCTRSGR
ncbi:MAG: hypothetical protein ACLRSW_14175 [Christensenellaceae bacterium]